MNCDYSAEARSFFMASFYLKGTTTSGSSLHPYPRDTINFESTAACNNALPRMLDAYRQRGVKVVASFCANKLHAFPDKDPVYAFIYREE